MEEEEEKKRPRRDCSTKKCLNNHRPRRCRGIVFFKMAGGFVQIISYGIGVRRTKLSRRYVHIHAKYEDAMPLNVVCARSFVHVQLTVVVDTILPPVNAWGL